MKQILLVLAVAAMFSCRTGRWVGGNAKHFQQRADAKEKPKKDLNVKN